MKKLLAVLMALMLALSCVPALAEEPAEDTGVSFKLPAVTLTGELDLNEEAILALLPMFGLDESMAAQVQPILSLLDNLSTKAVLADNGLQCTLSLKGQDVLNLAGEVNKEGFAVATDLLPSYVLTVSFDTIKQLMEQMTTQMSDAMANVDVQKLIENVTGYVMEYVFTCMSAANVGEPEKGEFYQEAVDLTFNTCTPITIDMEAIKNGVLKLMDQIKNDEAVGSLLSALQGAGVPVEMGDEDVTIVVPEVKGYAYENTDENGVSVDGVSYVVVEVTFAEHPEYDVAVTVLANENGVMVTIATSALDSNIVISVQPTENGVHVVIETYIQEMYIGAEVDFTVGETIEEVSKLYFIDPENPILTEKDQIIFGGERTYTVMDENKTALDVAALMNDTEGQLSGSLMMDLLFNGMNNVMTKAMEAMPEEMAAVVNLMNGGAAEEEAPVEELTVEDVIVAPAE